MYLFEQKMFLFSKYLLQNKSNQDFNLNSHVFNTLIKIVTVRLTQQIIFISEKFHAHYSTHQMVLASIKMQHKVNMAVQWAALSKNYIKIIKRPKCDGYRNGVWCTCGALIGLRRLRAALFLELPWDPSRFVVAIVGPSWPLAAPGLAWRQTRGSGRRSTSLRATGMVFRSCSLIWRKCRSTKKKQSLSSKTFKMQIFQFLSTFMCKMKSKSFLLCIRLAFFNLFTLADWQK